MDAPASVSRLRDAINSHDPARVAECFAPGYHCEMPLHPERGFVGADHVLANWTGMFSTIADLRATVLRATVDGPETWSEWEMAGTAPDGSPTLLRGPVIWTETDDRIGWARFYLDRVGS
jgi:hypothetical protein